MKNQAGALLRGGSEPVPSEVEGRPPRSILFARPVRRPTAQNLRKNGVGALALLKRGVALAACPPVHPEWYAPRADKPPVPPIVLGETER